MPNDVSGSFELTEKVMVVETGAIGGTSNPDHPLAAAKQLAAMEKERSVGTPRYLLLGYLVAVCLCFLAAGIVVAVLPVPTQVLVPLISIYSVLLLVFMTATVYFTYIKPTECRHPLPLYVFASGLSNGLALNSLPGFLMATLSNDINKVSKSASLALSTTEFVLFGLGSSLIILYMFHVERTSPHFEEHRRLRAIISKNFGTFTVFTAFELWAAGCCGVSVNLVTLLALYGMHSGEISSSILAAELTGKVVVLGGLGYIAQQRRISGAVPENQGLTAVAIGLMLIPIVDALVTFLIFAAVNGGFAQPGSLYERIGNIAVAIAGSMTGVGLLMLFAMIGVLLAKRKSNGGVGVATHS